MSFEHVFCTTLPDGIVPNPSPHGRGVSSRRIFLVHFINDMMCNQSVVFDNPLLKDYAGCNLQFFVWLFISSAFSLCLNCVPSCSVMFPVLPFSGSILCSWDQMNQFILTRYVQLLYFLCIKCYCAYYRSLRDKFTFYVWRWKLMAKKHQLTTHRAPFHSRLWSSRSVQATPEVRICLATTLL